MFNFLKSKKTDVLEHWIAFVEGFQLAPSDFYDSVEKELEARQVPGMDIVRIDIAEGGLLSDKRLYLRMARERLVFDICAAPFGTSFFFSCRFAEIPAVVKIWQLLALIGALGFLGLISLFLFVRIFGLLAPFLWPVACILFCIFAIYIMRNAVAMGLKDLDKTLIQIPVINAVYEAWFRRETYYRHDTRLMYLEIVSGVVKRLAEEAVAAKGFTLIRQYEQAPILGELYKPRRPTTETGQAPVT